MMQLPIVFEANLAAQSAIWSRPLFNTAAAVVRTTAITTRASGPVSPHPYGHIDCEKTRHREASPRPISDHRTCHPFPSGRDRSFSRRLVLPRPLASTSQPEVLASTLATGLSAFCLLGPVRRFANQCPACLHVRVPAPLWFVARTDRPIRTLMSKLHRFVPQHTLCHVPYSDSALRPYLS